MARERVPALGSGEENDARGIGGAQPGDLFRRLADGFVPGDRRELRLPRLPGALHGAAQAVGVVERLHGSLAARAEAAAGDRVERIAFDFLDGGDAFAECLAVALDGAHALHDAHDGAAPRRAFRADGRMPLLLAGDEFVLRDEQGNQGIAFVPQPAAARPRKWPRGF